MRLVVALTANITLRLADYSLSFPLPLAQIAPLMKWLPDNRPLLQNKRPFLIYIALKADIFILSRIQMAMRHMQELLEPTEIYHLTLQLPSVLRRVLAPLNSLFWFNINNFTVLQLFTWWTSWTLPARYQTASRPRSEHCIFWCLIFLRSVEDCCCRQRLPPGLSLPFRYSIDVWVQGEKI